MIHNTPQHDKILNYDMTCEELARLCCTQDLTDSHMDWIIAMFNSFQNESIEICLNRITNIELFCQRRVLSRSIKPTWIVFILNVEKNKSRTSISKDDNTCFHRFQLFELATRTQSRLPPTTDTFLPVCFDGTVYNEMVTFVV